MSTSINQSTLTTVPFQLLNTSAMQALSTRKLPESLNFLLKNLFNMSFSIQTGEAFKEGKFKNLSSSGCLKVVTFIALKSIATVALGYTLKAAYEKAPESMVETSLKGIESCEETLKTQIEQNPMYKICSLHYESEELRNAVDHCNAAKLNNKSLYAYLQDLVEADQIPVFLKIEGSEDINENACDIFSANLDKLPEVKKCFEKGRAILKLNLYFLKLAHKSTHEALLQGNALEYSKFLI